MLGTLPRLRLAHLFMGMMFWYGIEQLFLNHYLHNPSARAYLTIVYAASVLVLDIPGGVLADKIGRRRTVLLACVIEVLAVIVLGMSRDMWQYLIGSVLFGLFISMINGAAEALLYDHLKAEGLTKRYAKEQGLVNAYFLIGAAIANLASGFMAEAWGLRAAYFVSTLPGIAAFILIWGVAEPPFEQSGGRWHQYVRQAGRYITQRPRLLLYGLQFVLTEVAILTIGEFGQIYLLHFGLTPIQLGLLWSAVAVAAAVGRFVAHHGQSRPQLVMLGYCGAIVAFIFTHSAWGILLYLLVYGYTEAASNVAETEVQDASESNVRATLFSCVSFGGNLVAIPAVYLFNRVYLTHSIFLANEIIGVIVCVLLLLTITANRRTIRSAIVHVTLPKHLDRQY